ncbi:MAG: ROK family protein, partial [Bacillota bacterium]
MEKLIGIDIGGTTSAVLLGDVEGGILDKIAFATRTDKGPTYTLQKIYNGIKQILENNRLSPGGIACMGVSCGGPLDSKRGLIMSPPNLPGWDRIAIV